MNQKDSRRMWDRAVSVVFTVTLLAIAILAIGCTQPTMRHAELEWEYRHEMPVWDHETWNAWEAELAAALDLEQPDPPMFPQEDSEESEGQDDVESEEGDAAASDG